MTNEEILKEQVASLEKLLGFKDAIIKQLETELATEKAKLKFTPKDWISPQTTNPFEKYNDLIIKPACLHEYDYSQAAWPAKCKKCGFYQQMTVTCEASGIK